MDEIFSDDMDRVGSAAGSFVTDGSCSQKTDWTAHIFTDDMEQ
jgi:hypothetical protein